jgi:hypothetical protein
MRTLIIAAAVATMGMTGIAIADEAKGPTVMTDAQMENITAGTGRDNVGDEAWAALFDHTNFAPHHLPSSDGGVIDHAGFQGVLVPSAVPQSHAIPP